MNRHQTLLLLAGILSCSPLHAQFGGGGPSSGPQVRPEMIKLFGEHKAFSAKMDFQVTEPGAESPMTVPGQLAVQEGQSRFEMNLGEAKGGRMPPNAAEQMKQMGMDRIIAISQPNKKRSLLIYPGLEAYVEMEMDEAEAAAAKAADDLEIERTEQGKETVNGHECVKNKVVFKNEKGTTEEATVWNASDLKEFPVKIEATEQGNTVVMTFSDIQLAAPGEDKFDAPSSYAKYDDMMTMMQQVMMKRMGAGAPGN